MLLLKQSLTALKLLQIPAKTATVSVRSHKRWLRPTLQAINNRRKALGPAPPQPRSSFLEWNYDAELYAFAKRLGEEFEDRRLRQALTQRSYVNAQEDESLVDNSSLIAEGGSFVNDYVSERLLREYPKAVVAAVRDFLMSEEMLAHVAKHMGVADVVLTAEFPVSEATLADTFLAVVAALKLSTDDTTARKFVDDFLVCQLTGKDVYEIWDPKNPYDYLVSLLKERGISAIEPRLCNESASNTILANFQVGLYSDKKLLGIGWGESVEIAKETAAIDAIKNLNESHVHLT